MQAQTELNFAAAENAKQAGMMMAEDNANTKINGWSRIAFNILREFLMFHNDPFLAEEVRSYASQRGLDEPPSKRAWGGVITRAARQKLIKSIGFGLTTNPLAHRTPATLWCKV